jgi:chemotaxis signal transduction protein
MATQTSPVSASAFLPTAGSGVRLGLRFADGQPLLALAAGTQAEIALDARYCAIPNTPLWFHGVVNLRGAIYPVFDVAAWCGIDLRGASRRVVLLDQGEQCAGVLCVGEPLVLSCAPTPETGRAPTRLAPFLTGDMDSNHGPAFAFDHRRFFAQAGRDRGTASAT